VCDYFGFHMSDDLDSSILLAVGGPDPRTPMIGVIFERDYRILSTRFPDPRSLQRAITFCGTSASFDFQTRPGNMLVEMIGDEDTTARKSSDGAKVAVGGHKKKRRNAGDTASIQHFTKDLDGSALHAANLDEDSGSEDADETASKVGRVSKEDVRESQFRLFP
jgi:hypothetical protein